uniref:Uncharacterized protein n=1 Tax=Anguilla anguilla TaxID=7936 RepID=A0A0E9QU40_ANGAN
MVAPSLGSYSSTYGIKDLFCVGLPVL